MTQTAAAPPKRAFIQSSDAEGLLVEVAPDCWETFTWTRVASIVGFMVDHSYGARVIMISIEVGPGQALLLCELDPAWSQIVETLHIHLPYALRFENWAMQILSKPGITRIYGR